MAELLRQPLKVSVLAFLSICVFLSSAQAEIYKCEDDEGNAVFSDTQCSLDAKKIVVDTKKTGMKLELNIDKGTTNKYEPEIPRQAIPANSKTTTDVCKFIQSTSLRRYAIQHKILVGMKAKHVVKSWGRPTRTHGSKDSIWVYDFPTGKRYVHFKGNCVYKIDR